MNPRKLKKSISALASQETGHHATPEVFDEKRLVNGKFVAIYPDGFGGERPLFLKIAAAQHAASKAVKKAP